MKRRILARLPKLLPWFLVALLVVAGLGMVRAKVLTGANGQPSIAASRSPLAANGRPQLSPLPAAQEVWNCEVIVVGGSLGGIAAAAHAMQSGATTCLIELAPWLGGQISAQGVSAVDESLTMRATQNFSQSWFRFKNSIEQQPVSLPGRPLPSQVKTLNHCWVGTLCFPPQAGATASVQLLQAASAQAPQSRWDGSIAFKGAEFDSAGKDITAVYAVRRVPRSPDYVPQGRFSRELAWYSWSTDAAFTKIPLRLQAVSGKRLIVIDATDTGELIAWANVPHRLGSESRQTTGEVHAAPRDNPSCTQAFTFPFAIALHDDGGTSRQQLAQVQPLHSRQEHRRDFAIQNIPIFSGRSFFHYRRMISTTGNDPLTETPALGDVTIVNWNPGNDWGWMNPPLLLTAPQIDASGQRQNWLGGLSPIALRHAEDHALLFAQWVLETQPQPEFPLSYLSGADAPMGTISGLSMTPYIREGRRILGRRAWGQQQFFIREADLRLDLPGGRDFTATTIAVAHYDIDMHGCRDRNWNPTGEATSAPASEFKVRPVQIPIESLIPQTIDNLLIGGKSIAVTHIVNAVTRTHYSEWSIGAAAGSIAAYLTTQAPPHIAPADIVPQKLMPQVQKYLIAQGLRLEW